MVSEKGPKIYRYKHIKYSFPPEKKANIDQKKKFISLTKLFYLFCQFTAGDIGKVVIGFSNQLALLEN